MGPYTLTAILVLCLGCTFPSWASVVRFHCMPGAYLPDADDCTRYYQCVGKGSIRALSCTDGTHYCGNGEQQCCNELVDSDADCEIFSDKATQTNNDKAQSESSDASGQHGQSADVQSDEDDRSFDFVGPLFQFMTKQEEQDTSPHALSDEHEISGSIEEEPVSSVEILEGKTEATAKGGYVKPVFESDDGQMNKSVGNGYSINYPSNKEAIIKYGDTNQSSENGDEVYIKEVHDSLSDNIKIVDVVRGNTPIEAPENPAIIESKEASNDEIYRKKRNDEAKLEEISVTENINEGNLKKKKDKHNQGSDMEVSSLISSEERGPDEDRSQPIVGTTAGESIVEETGNHKENASSNLELDADNSKSEILETPRYDKPISVNPSIVHVHAGGSLSNSSHEDYKDRDIDQIVKSILKLADEQSYLIHREMLSPSIGNDNLHTTDGY